MSHCLLSFGRWVVTWWELPRRAFMDTMDQWYWAQLHPHKLARLWGGGGGGATWRSQVPRLRGSVTYSPTSTSAYCTGIDAAHSDRPGGRRDAQSCVKRMGIVLGPAPVADQSAVASDGRVQHMRYLTRGRRLPPRQRAPQATYP